MIDRKALWFAITVIIAMVGSTVWRLSLLPDWHMMPLDGPNGTHRANSLIIFSQPLALTVATVNMYGRKWVLGDGTEAETPWRRWGTMFVVGFAVLLGSMQAFILASSLGYVTMDWAVASRAAIAATGLLLMVAGNAFPKLPWVPARLRLLQLDPWQQKRHVRFSGKLLVALGLYLVLIAIALPLFKLLPRGMAYAVILIPAVMMAAAKYWHIAKLKREPAPPQSA